MSANNGQGGEEREKKGFAGLASLVSDVSSVLDRTSREAPGANTSPAETSTEPNSFGTLGSTGPIDAEAGLDRGVQTSARTVPSVDAKRSVDVASGAHGAHRSSSRVWLWIGALVAFSVMLAAMFSADKKDSTGPKQSNDHVPALVAAGGLGEPPRRYAVAAMKANMRALPSTRSKVIGTLGRGSPVVEIERRDGFIKFRRSDNIEGWISTDILIEMANLSRLQSSTPAEYIKARERLEPAEKLTAHISRLEARIRSLLAQVEGRQDGLATIIGEIESYPRPTIDRDGAAGVWFSLAGRAAADAGDHTEAISLTTAAVYADPLNVEYHTALGFFAIALGQRELLQVAAAILPALAPASTNTWIVIGVDAAFRGKAELAHGAILTAISRSRNKATTLRVLRDMVARSKDDAVIAAVTGAMAAADEANSTASAVSRN